jgi:hypothetical protein
LTHSPRPVEIYSKEGSIAPYGSFFAVIPEFGVGINVLSAGDDASIVTRFVFDQVVQQVVPKLEELARSQAGARYAGRYADDSGNNTILLTVDDGPGLMVAEWMSNGVPVVETWALLTGQDPASAEARVYPVGEGERWQVSLTYVTGFGIFEKACMEWVQISSFWYKGLPADEFDFSVQDGSIAGVEVPGLRQNLQRKP